MSPEKHKDMANGDVDNVSHDLISLLSSEERDYLVRNNGDQVLFTIYSSDNTVFPV